MKFIRGLFITLIALVIAGLLVLESPVFKSHAIIWLQNEVKTATGYELIVSDLEFSFPHLITLKEVHLKTDEHSKYSADSLAISSSWLRMYFNSDFQGIATIEGLKVGGMEAWKLPQTLTVDLKWDANRGLNGEIALLSTGQLEMRGLVWHLANQKTAEIPLIFFRTQELRICSLYFEGLCGELKKNLQHQTWEFSLANQKENVSYVALSASLEHLERGLQLGIGHFELKWNEHFLSLRKPIRLNFSEGSDLTFRKIPMAYNGLRFPLSVKGNKNGLHLWSDLDIAPLVHKYFPVNLWLTGKLALNLDVVNLADAPEIKGRAKFYKGRFEHWESGTIIDNIEASFEMAGQQLRMVKFEAKDKHKGLLNASGVMDLFAEDLPFKIEIHVDNAEIFSLDHTEILLSGDAQLIGNRFQALLKGELVADRADMELADKPTTINHDIEVVYINQDKDMPAPTPRVQSQIMWPFHLDLHVYNKGTISIYSKELTSEWKGDIRVSGTLEQPLINGELRIVKGDYLFNGKKFKISQGTISFAGDVSKKTSLYVIGEIEIQQMVAQVVLKGPLTNPSLLLRSKPAMSQQEILAWILFGRGVKEISSFEGKELTQSLSELRGSGSQRTSFVTRLKDSLGIDRFDISGGMDNGAKEEISVQVGKYILPQVFLGIKRDMSSAVNSIGIEANISKNLKFQAEMGDDSAGQLHLKWKHDY